ncbi:hypothetical protein SB861_05405 [Paraburkholderia sp. SIMBA_049]
MDVHRVIVRAGIGELRAIPVWRHLMQLGVRVGSWKIRLDRELNVESPTIDLPDPPGVGVDELRSRLKMFATGYVHRRALVESACQSAPAGMRYRGLCIRCVLRHCIVGDAAVAREIERWKRRNVLTTFRRIAIAATFRMAGAFQAKGKYTP